MKQRGLSVAKDTNFGNKKKERRTNKGNIEEGIVAGNPNSKERTQREKRK